MNVRHLKLSGIEVEVISCEIISTNNEFKANIIVNRGLEELKKIIEKKGKKILYGDYLGHFIKIELDELDLFSDLVHSCAVYVHTDHIEICKKIVKKNDKMIKKYLKYT